MGGRSNGKFVGLMGGQINGQFPWLIPEMLVFTRTLCVNFSQGPSEMRIKEREGTEGNHYSL